MRRGKRCDAADWLQTCLINNGLEAGSGWVLELVDGVAERLNLLSQSEVEMLTDAVQSTIEAEADCDEAEARNLAECAVNTIFEFLGLWGEPPSPA